MHGELEFLQTFSMRSVSLDADLVVTRSNFGIHGDDGRFALAVLSLEFDVVVALVTYEIMFKVSNEENMRNMSSDIDDHS